MENYNFKGDFKYSLLYCLALNKVTLQRWLISIVIGPVFGLIGLKGILGLALYGCAIALISLAIVNRHG